MLTRDDFGLKKKIKNLKPLLLSIFAGPTNCSDFIKSKISIAEDFRARPPIMRFALTPGTFSTLPVRVTPRLTHFYGLFDVDDDER